MTDAWNRLRAWVTAHPLAAPVLAGAAARLVAGLVAVGFHARDDYFHVLAPALRWIDDPTYDWDATTDPGAGIRSHLIPRAVWLLIRSAQGLGITEPESVLRVIYVVAGAYALLLIPGVNLAARRLLDERAARLATWLAAIHFAMPYTGTRLLIEAMAMPPLAFGLWAATYPTFRRQLVAGLLVGLACWFRFQTGLAATGLVAAVAWTAFREGRWRCVAERVGGLVAGGTLAVLIQGTFDLATTGDFLGPVIRNIVANMDPPAGLSRSTPAAYLGFWLLLTVPPATLVVVPAMVRAARRLPLVTWPFVVFVIVHSAIPHKEERFMLPVMPLFLILLAAVPSALTDAKGRFWEWARKVWPATRGYLLVVYAVALIVACTAQSQANLRQAVIILRHDPAARAVVSIGPEVQAYFLGDRNLPIRRTSKIDIGWLARTLEALRNEGVQPNRFLGFEAESSKVAIMLAALAYRCKEPIRLDGWWLDRLVYRLNPRRNLRRSPVLIWHCEPPVVASKGTGTNPPG
ncbi:MAG: hypothetical protein V3T05_12135 [Myxococcota bacterium]